MAKPLTLSELHANGSVAVTAAEGSPELKSTYTLARPTAPSCQKGRLFYPDSLLPLGVPLIYTFARIDACTITLYMIEYNVVVTIVFTRHGENTALKPAKIWGTLLICLLSTASHADGVTVYASASLTTAIKEISSQWQSTHKDIIKSSFASASTLAKQIEAGAPADIFASADNKWMDYLSSRQLIIQSSRRNILGKTLVMIAPTSEPRNIPMTKGKSPAVTGRLCMGEPTSVPAGIYGKQALTNLGWWPALEKFIVGTEDVRTALAFVERGECPLGIVYETDARTSNKVMVAGRFPTGLHDPVVYPFALLPNASPVARDFFIYLISPEVQKVFVRHGFVILER